MDTNQSRVTFYLKGGHTVSVFMPEKSASKVIKGFVSGDYARMSRETIGGGAFAFAFSQVEAIEEEVIDWEK